MPIDTSVKFFAADMPRAPSVTGKDIGAATYSSVSLMLKACLVDGFGEVNVISGEIVDGVCTLVVAPGDTFPLNSTVKISGVVTPSALNGEYKILESENDWFSFETELANDFVQGANIKAKYAPAGWLQPWPRQDNTIVFRTDPSVSNGRYLQIVEDSFESVKVHAFRRMKNRYGGTAMAPPSTTYANYHWGKSDANNENIKYWYVIANKQFLYLIIKPYSTSVTNLNRGDAAGAFGDFIWELKPERNDGFNTILNGKDTINTARQYNYRQGLGRNDIANSNYFFLLKDITWGEVKACSTYVFNLPHSYNDSTWSGPPFPDIRHGGMNILPYYIVNTENQFIGRMPGQYFVNHYMPYQLRNASIVENSVNGRKYIVATTLDTKASYNYNLDNSPNADNGSAGHVSHLLDITGPWE